MGHLSTSGWVRTLSSEEPKPRAGKGVSEEQPATVAAEEKSLEPGEEWIEEYEPEKEPTPPGKRRRRIVGVVIAVAIVVILVLWTLLSPEVLPVAGVTYLESSTYANLGFYSGELDIWWLFNVIHLAETTWGVSVNGTRNVTAGEPATFHVLVTKVSESMKNPWFVGTSVDLKNVEMYTEDGTLLGSMVSESDEPFGPMAEVEATFDSPGEYEFRVYIEFTVYSKMIVGFLPVKTVRITTSMMDQTIIAS